MIGQYDITIKLIKILSSIGSSLTTSPFMKQDPMCLGLRKEHRLHMRWHVNDNKFFSGCVGHNKYYVSPLCDTLNILMKWSFNSYTLSNRDILHSYGNNNVDGLML